MTSSPNPQHWSKFISLLLLTLGIGFSVAGIVFFFAYNWAELHKFVKFGLIGMLLVAATLLSLRRQWDPTVRKCLLTSAAVLVGVLFAVFGQVYQTGANAYDFFLAWTVFVVIWVVAASFPPLWALFLLLVNTTLILYAEQVANHWPAIRVYSILFAVNLCAVVVCKWLLQSGRLIPLWFTNVLALATIGFSTIGIVIGIYAEKNPDFILLIALAVVAYAAAVWYALAKRSVFYLSIVALSTIILISAAILRISDDGEAFLFTTLFIMGSATLTVKLLLHLQKTWTHEQP